MATSIKLEELPDEVVAAIEALDAKSASNIMVLDVGEVLGICDWFVIASAGNDRLVRTLIDEVEAQVREVEGRSPIRVEGRDERRWVLMDYGDVVIHVLLDEARHFYELERLWKDVPVYRHHPAAAGPSTGDWKSG